MALSKLETRIIPGAYDAVFRAVCDAAMAASMMIRMADPATGVVEMTTDVSLHSWGEKVSVHLSPGHTDVQVTIISALQFGLVDWGRNGKNINTLFDHIARAATHPAGAWHPDPVGRHESRWWDGGRWTEHVSDAGRIGVDPL